MARTISITATEPQGEFHALDSKYSLFVGGFASGKSETMVNQAILDVSHSPDALVALYAPTYDLVSLIIVRKLTSKLEELGIRYVYKKQENRITITTPGFGDFILRTLDNPERIVGYEAYRSHIDELDTLPTAKAKEVWEKIIARNRQKPSGLTNCMNRVSAYTTPEGYAFCYERWVQGKSDLYKYVQAPTRSNIFLENVDEYIEALRATYPPALIEAYIEGKFTNLKGGTVYNEYNRNTHRSHEVIKEGETLYIGCDFNVTKQAASIAVKRAGGKEFHYVEELTDMYDTPEMIRLMQERYAGHHIVIYPDASGKSRKTVDASTSDIALLEQAGFEVRVNGTNPRVKDRVLATNAALSHGHMYVNDKQCPTIANCLEQQAYDNNGEPDKKSGNDHQNDATTYPIAYELPIRKPVAHIDFSYK